MNEAAEPALLASFVTIAGVWLVTVLSPGPNFVATVHAALSRSRGHGLILAAGICLGTTIWATVSLFGLGLLFQTAGWLYVTAKLAGAAYLVYLGARMILSARRSASLPDAGGPRLSAGQAFRRGLLTDLSNPKAAAFFTSLFAVAVPPEAPLWFDASIVLAVVAIAGGWYAIVACLMTLDPVAALYRRCAKAVSALAGAVFIGAGLGLAAER